MFGPCNSAYAVNLTYGRHTADIYIYHVKSRLNTPVWGSLQSNNYSPLCRTYYLAPGQYFTSLFRLDPLPSRELETNTFKDHWCSALLQNLVELSNKRRQVSMFLILLFKLLTQFPLRPVPCNLKISHPKTKNKQDSKETFFILCNHMSIIHNYF